MVPRDRPGRGLVDGPRHVLAALPRIDGRSDPASLGAGVTDLVGRVAEAWRGPVGPKLRLLPEVLPAGELIARSGPVGRGSDRLVIGLREDDLEPVGLEPGADPLWLVLGDSGSGRTNALRGYLREVVRTRTPDRTRVLLVDVRRSSAGVMPPSYLLDHVTTPAQAGPVVAALAAELAARVLVQPDVQRAEKRPEEVFVVVDDLDLLAAGSSSPLLPLQPLLAMAGDLGLRLVVARRSGGASRALYEPVLQTLRDLAAPTLLLSGSPDEGPLADGVRPVPAPPGRGRLVTRARGVEVVQLAWHAPSA